MSKMWLSIAPRPFQMAHRSSVALNDVEFEVKSTACGWLDDETNDIR